VENLGINKKDTQIKGVIEIFPIAILLQKANTSLFFVLSFSLI
jgi:hypothetical protein